MDMSVCGSSSAGIMKYNIIITFFPKFSYYFVDLLFYHVALLIWPNIHGRLIKISYLILVYHNPIPWHQSFYKCSCWLCKFTLQPCNCGGRVVDYYCYCCVHAESLLTNPFHPRHWCLCTELKITCKDNYAITTHYIILLSLFHTGWGWLISRGCTVSKT